MASINKPLTEILDISEQVEIVREIWQKEVRNSELSNYESYLKYYRGQMKRLQWGNIEEDYLINRLAAKSHDDLLQLVNRLSSHRNQTYADIRREIQSLFPCSIDIQVKQSIDLALRIWLMLNVRDAHLQLHYPMTPRLQWIRDGKVGFIRELRNYSNLVCRYHTGQLRCCTVPRYVQLSAVGKLPRPKFHGSFLA